MRINVNDNSKLTDSEWSVVLELTQLALDAKDGKIEGLTINMDAREIEDCRSIIRKAKENV